MAPTVLDARALNRALMARQGLIERTRTPPLEMVERLVGMQAQVPSNPYVALWSRIEGFRPEALGELIAARAAVRAGLMRGTIHLVSARDLRVMAPLTAPLMARVFGTNHARQLGGADLGAVVAAGRELLAERPRTRAELAALLAPRFPQAEPEGLGHAVTFNVPLVQVTPRGLWKQSMQPTWAPAEGWIGAPLERDATADELVLRYLAAFGPASTSDLRTWCGITGLRDVVARLRPALRVFADERGRELLDVEDGLLPDPATPVPPRFLPEYDNVALAHADRARVFDGRGPDRPLPRGTWIGSLLVDGFFRAFWKIEGGTLTLERFRRARSDPAGTRAAIEAEAHGLLALVAPDAAQHRVVL